MNKKITNRESAEILLNSENVGDILITQAEASRILLVSRERINQYVKHPEHSKNLGVTTDGSKIKLSLIKVLNFKDRREFRGKRGKQKTNISLAISTI